MTQKLLRTECGRCGTSITIFVDHVGPVRCATCYGSADRDLKPRKLKDESETPTPVWAIRPRDELERT